MKDAVTKDLGSFCVHLGEDLSVCVKLELLYECPLDAGGGPYMVKVLTRLLRLLLATRRTES